MMKKYTANLYSANKFVATALLMTSMLLLLNCKGKDPEPSATDKVKAQLTSSTWTLQKVTVDDVDQTSAYSGMTIKFTETTYTTTKGGLVWPASGTWAFTDDTATAFKRDDGVEVKTAATDTSLTLTLTWAKTTLGSGRVESTKGVHIFTFKK